MKQKIAIIGDLHVPFEDKKALALFTKIAKAWKPDLLVCLGDLGDLYSLSGHPKNPRKDKGFAAELKEVHAVLDQLDGLAKRKIFCAGNHEVWLDKYLARNAPALIGHTDIPSAYQLKERGWEYYPYQQPAVVGKLHFVHDLGYSGVNFLRQTIKAYPANIIVGHVHRFGMYVDGNLRGETHTAASFGWLGDPKQIEYLPSVKVKQDWVKGFGLAYLLDDGTAHINGVKIIKDKAFIEGKLVTL